MRQAKFPQSPPPVIGTQNLKHCLPRALPSRNLQSFDCGLICLCFPQDFEAKNVKLEQGLKLLTLMQAGVKPMLETMDEEATATFVENLLASTRTFIDGVFEEQHAAEGDEETDSEKVLSVASNFVHYLEKDLSSCLDDDQRTALAALLPRLHCREAWEAVSLLSGLKGAKEQGSSEEAFAALKEQSPKYTKFSAGLAEIAKHDEGPPWFASATSAVAAIQQIASEATEAKVELAVGRLEKLDKKACAWAESLGANPRHTWVDIKQAAEALTNVAFAKQLDSSFKSSVEDRWGSGLRSKSQCPSPMSYKKNASKSHIVRRTFFFSEVVSELERRRLAGIASTLNLADFFSRFSVKRLCM